MRPIEKTPYPLPILWRSYSYSGSLSTGVDEG